MMTGEARRRRASIFLVITSVLWLHDWFAALFVAFLVVWGLLHTRLEGEGGQGASRLWRRAWPPPTLVLVPLLLAGAFAYWVADVPVAAKVMPVALNVLALSVLAFGSWWRVFPLRSA